MTFKPDEEKQVYLIGKLISFSDEGLAIIKFNYPYLPRT